MKPVLFTVGGVEFYSYGFFVSMAFLVTYFVYYQMTKNDKKTFDKLLFEKLLLVLLAGIIGARALYIILYPSHFNSIKEWFLLQNGGLVSFGGILFGFITFFLLFKDKLKYWIDVSAVGFLAGAGTWRIGCFLTNDHPGVFSNAWYAIDYQVPAVLFELILSYIGFVVFYLIYKKRILRPGYIFFLVWGWYGLTRLIADNFRADPLMLGLKSGQVAGVVMLLISAIGVLVLNYKNKKHKK